MAGLSVNLLMNN